MMTARLAPLCLVAALLSCSHSSSSPNEPAPDMAEQAIDQGSSHEDLGAEDLAPSPRDMFADAEVDARDMPSADMPLRDMPGDMASDDMTPEEMGAPSPCAPAMQGAPSDDPFRRQRVDQDLPDDQPGAQMIHVLYVEPGDRDATARLDEDGSLRRSISAWNGWFASRTGGKKLRVDTCGGVIDITHIKLSPALTEAALATGEGSALQGPLYLRDRLEAELARSFSDPNKLYLVYYDGLALGVCGGAPHPPALQGRFTVFYRGGLFQSSILTRAAAAGDRTLTLYTHAQVQLPATPYDATLGNERVRVMGISGSTVTLASPLRAAAPSGATLVPETRIPDCRANPFSSDGVSLGYTDYAGVHEVLHALGVVSAQAKYHSTTAAPGHLDARNAAGTADLMYQGDQPWGCAGRIDRDPSASRCELDPAHENYWMLPAGSPALDLAKSAFIDPLPADAELPPGW